MEPTQSNALLHVEPVKQGEVFRLACMAANLAASTDPFLDIKTPEQCDAQLAAQAYMDSHPYAPETKLARF